MGKPIAKSDTVLDRGTKMADAAPKLPGRPARKPATPAGRRTLEALRCEIDRLFEDFGLHSLGERLGRSSVDLEPFWSGAITWGKKPAVDFLDNDKSFVVTAELPGMSEADVDVKYYDGMLMIRGEKKEDKEGRKKDHYLAERRYG